MIIMTMRKDHLFHPLFTNAGSGILDFFDYGWISANIYQSIDVFNRIMASND